MTVLEDALKGIISNEVIQVAKHEKIDITTFLKAISTGQAIIMKRADSKGITLMGMAGSKISLNPEINIGDIIRNTVSHFNGKGGGKNDYGQGFISSKGINSKEILKYIKENYFKV